MCGNGDEAVMEEIRARDRHTLQLAEKVDSMTFFNDQAAEQKLVRLENMVSSSYLSNVLWLWELLCNDFGFSPPGCFVLKPLSINLLCLLANLFFTCLYDVYLLVFLGLQMGLDYSYSQPSQDETFGGAETDSEYNEVESLIQQDQAQLYEALIHQQEALIQ
ncbi:hypothetical protein F2Q69_00010425 [Brassica cretica]|uniref:Uncharacterized protein n=1 Tax=Brassica cretica TaxID=69181 RepID=A0A8S9R409_BRACR|nr:hypothetical protein F2Q69_00010425 [Brassica cretica]